MDTAPHVEVRVTQRFGAPAERVFEAWLDPGIAGRWLFATAWRPMASVSIDARAGGAFRLAERLDGKGAVHTGRYVEIVKPRRLVFAISGGKRSQSVRVSVEFAPLPTGCELTLIQESVLPGDAAHTDGRWSGMLYGLASLLGE
jgi:uncharacterized protein YndB with AHSA1/START domain